MAIKSIIITYVQTRSTQVLPRDDNRTPAGSHASYLTYERICADIFVVIVIWTDGESS